MKTIILKWYGPYTDEHLESLENFGNGLYLITGKVKYQRTESEIQYCGITESTYINRLSERHHKKGMIKEENRKYWFSSIEYPKNYNRSELELAEKLIIYFWQPRLNQRKKIKLPEATTLINFWYTRDEKPRINQMQIYRDLSDVISWDGEQWRTGNLSVFTD